jgi:hypothetical protein
MVLLIFLAYSHIVPTALASPFPIFLTSF